MSMVSIGDLSQQFISSRTTTRIKSDLARLSAELSSGKKADVTAHLSGDTRAYSAMSQSLARTDAFITVAKEVSITFAAVQLSLDRIDTLRETGANDLVLLNGSSSEPQITSGAAKAKEQFSDMIAVLNGSTSGKYHFSGTAVATQPLPDAGDMITDILGTIADPSDPAIVTQAVQDWFSTGGGYDTLNSGNSMARDTIIGPNGRSARNDVSALSDEVREVLAATALGAVVEAIGGSLAVSDRGALLQTSGAGLVGAAQGVAALQSRIGFQEARVETTLAELGASRTSLAMSLNETELSDPFEVATRLEATQRQLELHFATTAKLSRLSLADYI